MRVIFGPVEGLLRDFGLGSRLMILYVIVCSDTHTQHQCIMGTMCDCLGIKTSRMRRSSLQGTDLVTERPGDELLTKAKLATFITCIVLCY